MNAHYLIIKWWIFKIIIYFLYNHHIETNFNKFSGNTSPEGDTPKMWNQHQHHQGETQSQMHHCIFTHIMLYKMHYICLFAYHYHMCVSFLHEPRYASYHAFTGSAQMAIQYFPHKIHITHFTRHCTVALCVHNIFMI